MDNYYKYSSPGCLIICLPACLNGQGLGLPLLNISVGYDVNNPGPPLQLNAGNLQFKVNSCPAPGRCTIANNLYCCPEFSLGQLVFNTHNREIKWNGNSNGVPRHPGIYVWMPEYREGGVQEIFLEGKTVLIR